MPLSSSFAIFVELLWRKKATSINEIEFLTSNFRQESRFDGSYSIVSNFATDVFSRFHRAELRNVSAIDDWLGCLAAASVHY